MPKAGYEYLLCYKLTVPIYDYTACLPSLRSGAGRGVEFLQKSISYLRYLSDLSDLAIDNEKDYLSFARQHKIPVNLMITLLHQASYLTKKLMLSLEEKHEKEGGFSEKLLAKRLAYRRSEL